MSPVLGVLDPLTGVVLLASGAAAWRGRPGSRVGLLLVVAGACWFAGSVVGVLAFVHRGPLVQLHVSYPTGRLHRRLAAVVVVVAWSAGLVEGIASAPWLTLTLSGLVALAALDIFARASGNARKAGGPALVSALVFAAMLGASSVNRLLDLQADPAIAATYDVVVALVACWLAVDLLTGRWTEATVADLVAQLGGEADPGGVQAALRQALGDPSLAIGYYADDRGVYVDNEGAVLDVRPSRDQVATVVEQQGAPVAVVVHAAAALDDPELMRAAMAAVRLAVGNVALRTRIRHQMTELSAARRGIVESADLTRRAVAARLEEGADRHLASVAVLLDTLDAPDLQAELTEARTDLRDLAQGLRPHLLDDQGLAGALPVLADRSPVPVALTVDIGRLPPATESALYFVCAEALTNVAKHAEANRVALHVCRDEGAAVVVVTDDGRGGADPRGSGLRGLADRVEALDGDLRLAATPAGGTLLTARIPLEERSG